MFSANTKLDAPSSHRSLGRAALIAWGGAAFTAATLPLVPPAPWLAPGAAPARRGHAAAGPAWLARAAALSCRHRRARPAFTRLGAARGFAFADDAIPAA